MVSNYKSFKLNSISVGRVSSQQCIV